MNEFQKDKELIMDDVNQSRIATTLSLIVGIWVAVSPAWIPMSAAMAASTLVVGIVMIVASLVQYFVKSSIPSWINGIAAAWLFLSVFMYSMSAGAVWSAVLSAIAVAALAIWDGVEVNHFAHNHPMTSM